MSIISEKIKFAVDKKIKASINNVHYIVVREEKMSKKFFS